MRPPILRRAVALALAVTLAGCDSQPQGALEVVVIGDRPTLADPDEGELSTGEKLLLGATAQGLVRLDARGQIEAGLAETWNVSDDGLSYIFRLANTEWPNGRKVTAKQVARLLKSHISSGSDNPLKDQLGAIDKIVPMTDRVLEIQLNAARPDLLQILAQPELALVNERSGTGPFAVEREEDALRLAREVPVPDDEGTRTEQLILRSADAQSAVRQFVAGEADLVLGGTFVDLPVATRADLPRGALRFDPASGLFGLMPTRADGLLADPDARRLLSQAIDRQALIAALAVPGLIPRATVLEPGLANIPDPTPPEWTTTPLANRRPPLAAAARQIFDGQEPPVIKIALPEGPGADIVLDRLQADWGALGVGVERVERERSADLKLIDEVAPSTSASWFLRRFRCGVAPLCDEQVDELLEGARSTPVQQQRSALLREASRQIDSLQLFIPLAAPIRWSLVANRVSGFAGNRFARHTLTGLEERLSRAE